MAKISRIALVSTASLMTIAACAQEKRSSTVIAPEEPVETAEARDALHASVLENAAEVMQAAVVDLSLALPPMTAPAERETTAGATGTAGAIGEGQSAEMTGMGAEAPSLTVEDEQRAKTNEPGGARDSRGAKAAPLPETSEPDVPPRSAAEAAERGDAGSVPEAVSPTAPAETVHPIPHER